MSAPVICPPSHSHGKAQGCYNKHHCRCDACRAKASTEAKRRKSRSREMGAARFAEVPFAPITPCTGEDAARVRRMIARHAPAAERAELAAMLGVPA